MGEPHDEVLGREKLCSVSCCNCFFPLFVYIKFHLYEPMFGSGESENSYILCSTLLNFHGYYTNNYVPVTH